MSISSRGSLATVNVDDASRTEMLLIGLDRSKRPSCIVGGVQEEVLTAFKGPWIACPSEVKVWKAQLIERRKDLIRPKGLWLVDSSVAGVRLSLKVEAGQPKQLSVRWRSRDST